VDLFWSKSNQQHGNACLNTALWRLRGAFHQQQSGGAHFLFTNYLGEVGFDSSAGCWIDIAEFESCWEQIRGRSRDLTGQDVSNIVRLISLYRGDLLEGLYNEWVLSERERFRLIYLASLAKMLDYFHTQNAPEKSLEYGHLVLAVDPLREDIHRTVMQLYLDLGQRSMAVRQYKICCVLLKDELNITPMAETQALYEQALGTQRGDEKGHGPAALPAMGLQAGYRDALSRVERAVDSLESARKDLYQARRALQGRSDSLEQDLPS
jgi:DNA-binding SARP family transcriptional activator